MLETPDRLRIDKWLLFARVARSRPLAAALVSEGKVRLNSIRIDAPGKGVKIGDILTLTLPHGVRVVRVLGLPARRGPASEATACWEDVEIQQTTNPTDRL